MKVKMVVNIQYIVSDWLMGKMATVEKPASGTFEILEVDVRGDEIYIRGHHTPWISQDNFTLEYETET